MIEFGPADSGSRRLSLPESVAKVVTHKELDLEVSYQIRFDGERLRVYSMEVISEYGVGTAALSKMKLPNMLRDLVYEYNPWLRDIVASGDTSKVSLAQLYWAEYVCLGSPRLTVQRQTGKARNTTNHRLKKLEAGGLIPKDRTRVARPRHA
jgi:hypothetical protein